MTTTPNLSLPYILAAQSQKHVTHNEALRALDALVQASVLDRNLSAPPASPAEGERYVVAASPTGAWAGQENSIAAFQDGAWSFFLPREGWIVWVGDEDVAVVWTGTTWTELSGSGGGSGGLSLNPATGGVVGVNATADGTNRLAVSSAASLFNHAGAGHQQKINKATSADTASQLFQTNFSGRAEWGLNGSDDMSLKVSPDGSTFLEVLIADRTTGAITLKRIGISGVLSPGTITGNEDNYAPTDLSTAGILRLTSDASREIRGLAGGAAGRILLVANAGANPIVLKDESVSATAANRFAIGSDITLGSDQTVLILYDGESSRWRVVGGTTAGGGGGGGGASAQVQIDIVTASGTWTKPAWAKKVEVFLIGPGGGGGSGRNGASATARSGGGGGAAGAIVHEIYDAADLPASLDVDIGAGGTGGTGVSTNTTNGNAGTAGGDTILRDGATQYLIANGGGGGAGGLNNSVPAGGAGVDGTFGLSMNGAPATQNGGAGVAATPNGTTRGPGSGGCGGGITTSNVASDGGPGAAGYRVGGTGRSAAGGAGATSNNTAGSAGTDKVWDLGTGGGGGGGKGANTTAGSSGVGGAGGIPGGGGGGGCSCLNGQGGSAAGGDGARGEAWFISIG